MKLGHPFKPTETGLLTVAKLPQQQLFFRPGLTFGQRVR